MKSLIVAAGLIGLAATTAYAQTPAAPAPPPRHERPKVDANGDGRITLAEAIAAADARFDRLDVNKDGRITKDELPQPRPRRGGPDGAAPPAPPAPPGPPAPGAVAKGPDGQAWRGHGGRHGMRRMGGMNAKMFARMDANDDGVVTKAEAEQAARRLFTFLDLNGDGVLSGKELPARGMGMGKPMGGRGPK